MLDALITSRMRRKVLAALFTSPGREFYMRELVRITGGRPNEVLKELARLESAGILKRRQPAAHRYYSTNEKCPIYPELVSLIEKTEGISQLLRIKLSGVKEIKFAFIYGSFAEGRAKAGSDVDLMIIGNVLPQKINLIVRELEASAGREINYSIYPEGEFLSKLGTGFIKNVIHSKKIMLIGEEDEFKRFAEGRQD